MITQQSMGPHRAFRRLDVTKAIEATAQRAGAPVPSEDHITWPVFAKDVDDPRLPAAFVDLGTRTVTAVAAWAPPLSDTRIQVLPTDGNQTLITVAGYTSAGPRIAVFDIVTDWPLEPVVGELVITPDELAAIAADALAGAE